MRLIKKKILKNGDILLICQRSFLFGMIKEEIQFIADTEHPKGYWNWLLLPDLTLINDSTSFQLDSWCKLKDGSRSNL